MGRPRGKRATVRELDSDTPVLELLNGARLELDSDDFTDWCADNNTFAVEYELGTFLVIAEKRARGGRYFIARAYYRGRRSNSYLSTLPSAEQLRNAAQRFAAKLAPDSADVTADLTNYVDELLKRETDPGRVAAAEALRALVDSLEQTTPAEKPVAKKSAAAKKSVAKKSATKKRT